MFKSHIYGDTWEKYIPAQDTARGIHAGKHDFDLVRGTTPGMSANAAEFVPGSLSLERPGQPRNTKSDFQPIETGSKREPVMSLVDPETPDPGTGRASSLRGTDRRKTDAHKDVSATSQSRTFRVKWARDEAVSAEGWEENQHSSTWDLWEGGQRSRWTRNERECSDGQRKNSTSANDIHCGKGKGEFNSLQSDRTNLLETCCWAYIDPKDEIQVGFSTEDMRQWFDAGYFPEDFLVALIEDPTRTKAPPRSEFYPLQQWFRDASQAFNYVPRF